MSFFKKLYQFSQNPPQNLPPAHYRWWVSSTYSAFIAGIFHFLFIFMFTLLGVKTLALLNVFSSAIWLICIYLNLNGYTKVAITLANIEILLHAWLCTSLIGWNTGFHYHILILPFVIFLTPWNVRFKIIATIMNLAVYILINYSYQHIDPLVQINPIIVKIFKYTNFGTFAFITSYLAFYYQNIVIEVEAKLEREHQKTNTALIERSTILAQLNEELSDAAEYVKDIIPEPITSGPILVSWKFIPSASLGGDAIGYHWIDDDNFAFYLMDVSGHGVGASLLAVSVLNSVRMQSLSGVDFRIPSEVLGALNRSYPSEQHNTLFFTMWYGVYNINSRELLYSTAGHPPGFFFADLNTEDTEIRELRTPNMVVGAIPDAVFTQESETISMGSALLIFSDGVFEFQKENGEMWSFKEFKDTSCKLINMDNDNLDKLLNYAKDLKKDELFDDDYTILLLTFR